jgi:hypothetical protein
VTILNEKGKAHKLKFCSKDEKQQWMTAFRDVMGPAPGEMALKDERKVGSMLLHGMIEDSLGKITNVVENDPVIGKNMELVKEVTMLNGLIGQMGKFLSILSHSDQ